MGELNYQEIPEKLNKLVANIFHETTCSSENKITNSKNVQFQDEHQIAVSNSDGSSFQKCITLNPVKIKQLDTIIRNYLKLLAMQSLKSKKQSSSFSPKNTSSLRDSDRNQKQILHVRLNIGLYQLLKRKNLEKSCKFATSISFSFYQLQKMV